MPHVEMTLQGINRFYGGDAPVAIDPALPAVRPRSLWVHGHPDKLHCLTLPDVIA